MTAKLSIDANPVSSSSFVIRNCDDSCEQVFNEIEDFAKCKLMGTYKVFSSGI